MTINPASTSSSDFARIQLDGIRCPALREGLCSVQQTFGEPYIPDMCSTFPRVLTLVDGVLERSLNLSCPEAARLVLTTPGSMTFESAEGEDMHRVGSYSPISTARHEGLNEIRGLVVEFLQESSRPLWKRLVVLGYATEELATQAGNPAASGAAIFRRVLAAFRQGDYDQIPDSTFDDHELQIEVVMELVVSRISSEYTTPRFLQCYGDFMRGLDWTLESTMEDVIGNYRAAFLKFWAPFVSSNEHALENYLVNYAFRTLFPFGSKKADQKLAIDAGGVSIWNEYTLLVTHYAIIRTLLIGMAGLYGDALGVDHLIRLVQSYTKAFQHSGSFAATAIKLLRDKGITDSRIITSLVTDQPAARMVTSV